MDLISTKLINNKYKIIEKIGEGAFGSIYKGENIRTHEYVAIKIESVTNQTKLIKNESIIYHYLSNMHGIPTVKWYGKDHTNYYMVINLLGNSLQKIKNKITVFSLKATMQLAIQIINLLKSIHEKGLVHRDIKPDNFLFGLNERKAQIYIIDFGFCKSFLNNNKHIDMKKTQNLIGSLTYASVNAHNYDELSRRDDIESLCYMLIYLISGRLEWQSINTNTNINKTIKQMKLNLTNNFDKSIIPLSIINVLKYVRELSFSDTPDYKYIADMFANEMTNEIKDM